MYSSMFGSLPFIEGFASQKPEPLSQYLPQVQDGVISAWLQNNIPPGAYVLDPFGASPKVSIEAARLGYRVIVTANNPITRFMLELLAAPPQAEQLEASLAELSASYIGAERIEPHIRSLYNTLCARCGSAITADAFYWEHGNPSPYSRSYTCPNCADSGEHACTAVDVELASHFTLSGLHKARALERVVSVSDPDRIHVEQALSVYMPRPLYALITLINKLEGLKLPPLHQKYLAALFLYAFDQATAMWRVPAQKERRRQLTIPRRYRENNLWTALEDAIQVWSAGADDSSSPSVPVVAWPDLPPVSGGICIYTGRFLALADSLKDISVKAVCSAIPRPNQAFWTLSALWAGWLWGREAVGSFRTVLHRQRYDWAWHTSALASVFKQLVLSLATNTPIFGLINEAEPGFVGAALIAAGISGCQLENVAVRNEQAHVQIVWKSLQRSALILPGSTGTRLAAQFARSYLEGRAEPAAYLKTISAAMVGIINSWQSEQNVSVAGQNKNAPQLEASPNNPESQNEISPASIYATIFNAARDALSYRSGFLQYSLQDIQGSDAPSQDQGSQGLLFKAELDTDAEGEGATEPVQGDSTEPDQGADRDKPTRSSEVSSSTLLWLREPGQLELSPITDRYEQKLVAELIAHPGASFHEIDRLVCAAFPGLYTPPLPFLELCLDLYAVPASQEDDHWVLRPEDDPIGRQYDLELVAMSIQTIGEQLGYDCTHHATPQSKPFLTWSDQGQDLGYRFFPTTSAAIVDFVLTFNQPAIKGIIVIPASRANLLIYKLRRDPRLSRAFHPLQGNWRFLKYRHLRSLVELPVVNRENLDQLLSLDPISFNTPQLWMI